LGIATAYMIFKCMRSIHDNNLAVMGLFISTIYIPFFISGKLNFLIIIFLTNERFVETLQLSGIVTILFSGIASRRYGSKNISSTLRRQISQLFHLMSYTADTASFLLLGLAVFSLVSKSYYKDI
jgi:NhaP-type Na+/H+ or K+/H+ antiporter